jgi:predicted Zn-dependent peptidase
MNIKQQDSEFNDDQPNIDIDQLSKLKNLLNEGVITQEEFEAKKKQILNL